MLHVPVHVIIIPYHVIVEGDKAVQDLVFLEQRTKSKNSASLVASGPAGRPTPPLQ